MIAGAVQGVLLRGERGTLRGQGQGRRPPFQLSAGQVGQVGERPRVVIGPAARPRRSGQQPAPGAVRSVNRAGESEPGPGRQGLQVD